MVHRGKETDETRVQVTVLAGEGANAREIGTFTIQTLEPLNLGVHLVDVKKPDGTSLSDVQQGRDGAFAQKRRELRTGTFMTRYCGNNWL